MSLFKNKKKEEISPKVQTANDFVNVMDIKNRVLYSKDMYVFGFIRVPPISAHTNHMPSFFSSSIVLVRFVTFATGV